MKCSLWLVPPARASNLNTHRLHRQIEEIAVEHGGPTFPPHITIVGGIEVQDEKHATQLCERLLEELKGKFQGGIDCQFPETLRSMKLDDEGASRKLLWNQALVAVARRTKSLVELTRASREVFGKETVEDDLLFAPPLLEPHLSLFYGDGPLPADVTECWLPPASFVGTDLALWSTTPTTLEGVVHWKELCRVSLV